MHANPGVCMETDMQTSNVLSLTIPRAVELSGIGRSRLYELIKSGDIQIRKCGSRTLIRYEDLKRFIDALPSAQDLGGEHGQA